MLSNRQLITIIINAIVIKMIITFPHNIMEICGNAAWISAIYCTILSCGLFLLTCVLFSRNQNIISTAEIIGGKTAKIIIGIPVFIIMSLNFFSMLRIYPELIRLVLLQKTYVEIIGMTFLITIILGAYCGLESIGRVHSIFIPIAGVFFILFLILQLPAFKIQNIMPILGNGFSALFLKDTPQLSVFSDILMLNFLLPYSKSPEDFRKNGLYAIIIGGICVTLIFAAYGLTYPYPASENFLVPVYQLERLIRLSSFFTRFESLFQFLWSIAILIHGALYLAILSEIWKCTFTLSHSKPLIIPIAITLLGMSLALPSLSDTIMLESIINRWIFIPSFAVLIITGSIFKIKLFHVKHSVENSK